MFDNVPIVPALVGGLMIGTAATLLLLNSGRIAGISGILNGLLDRREDSRWRLTFMLGLLGGAAAFYYLSGAAPDSAPGEILWLPMLAGGFLVGFGTRLGGGCTSGHGVCGLGRLSLRSLVSTLVYVFTGMLIVFLVRHIMGGG